MKPQKPSVLLSLMHQLNSAETLLYETLVFFSSFVGLIGSWLLSKVSVVFAVISVVYIVCMIIAMNVNIRNVWWICILVWTPAKCVILRRHFRRHGCCIAM